MFDKIPDYVKTVESAAEKTGYTVSDIGIYLQPIVQGTNCHCEFNLFYNPASPADVERVKKLSLSAAKSLLGRGAFFSRPYGDTAKLVFERDRATAETLKKVKGIFDPNHIMNPGKLCF
jgi:FAD/FMN-containing dehydrogenase